MRWKQPNVMRSSVDGRWRLFLCIVWSLYFLGTILILSGASAKVGWKLVDLRSQTRQTGELMQKHSEFGFWVSRLAFCSMVDFLGLKIVKNSQEKSSFIFFCRFLHFLFLILIYSSSIFFRRCEFFAFIFSNFFVFIFSNFWLWNFLNSKFDFWVISPCSMADCLTLKIVKKF